MVERNPSDPEFILRLREWDKKHVCPAALGLPPGTDFDVEDLFGIHRFLFETDPDNFPITRSSVELSRHQINRHLSGELSWNSCKITTYRLPELLVHSHSVTCDSCQGDLDYCISQEHGIVLECRSCSGVFPLDASEFGYPDRFEESVFVVRPANKRELLVAGLFPTAG